MADQKLPARTKEDLIVEVWEQLDCDSVGAAELEQIQKAIRERFGEGAVDSPASIARLLADEGAILRHPEVLEFDTTWRRLGVLIYSGEVDFTSLPGAAIGIRRLVELQRESVKSGDQVQLRRLREFAANLRDELLLMERSKTATGRSRAEAKEIIEWVSIWQRSPDLFVDWLDLRCKSPEFVKLFPDFVGFT
jgi:hypothetical protein